MEAHSQEEGVMKSPQSHFLFPETQAVGLLGMATATHESITVVQAMVWTSTYYTFGLYSESDCHAPELIIAATVSERGTVGLKYIYRSEGGVDKKMDSIMEIREGVGCKGKDKKRC